jgi:hypothetical protein
VATNLTSVCETAYRRWQNAALWLNLWSILLFIFGTTVVIFLVASILLFIRQDWLPGALTTLGTIVQGVGVKWVVDRRAIAKSEEITLYDEYKNSCPDTEAADKLKDSLKLW